MYNMKLCTEGCIFMNLFSIQILPFLFPLPALFHLLLNKYHHEPEITHIVLGSMKEILLFDGGFGTEIPKYVEANGKETSVNPLWCSRYMKQNRDACVQVFRSYIRGKL